MKIAFIIMKMGSGGAERSLSALSSYMSKTEDVTVFVLDGTDSFYPFDDKVNVRYLSLDSIPSGKSIKRFFAVVKRAFTLRKAVKNEHPDVLIGMSHIMSAYAVFCTAFTKCRAVGTERSNPFKFNSGLLITALRKITSLLCDGFVCQTKKAASFFPSSVQKKCAVIPNAVFNPHVFETAVPSVREKNIAALGRLEVYKGFDVLIKSFKSVSEKHPDHTLTIYGDGKEYDSLSALSRSLGIEDRVIFAGTDENAIQKISQSSVFVLSSRFEGMPNALIEAMASGVPCVSTDCDMGPSELIVNGENGLLVPVDDTEALTKAVDRILCDKTLSDKLSKNALSLRDSHNIASVCEKWLCYLKS